MVAFTLVKFAQIRHHSNSLDFKAADDLKSKVPEVSADASSRPLRYGRDIIQCSISRDFSRMYSMIHSAVKAIFVVTVACDLVDANALVTGKGV